MIDELRVIDRLCLTHLILQIDCQRQLNSLTESISICETLKV